MVFMVWAYHKLGDLWYLWFWANHKLFNLWYAILDLWRGTPQVLPMSTFEPISTWTSAREDGSLVWFLGVIAQDRFGKDEAGHIFEW